jgi:hypothetical protein
MNTYRGVIVRESLRDPSALEAFQIESEEHDIESDWHLVTVTGPRSAIEQLPAALADGPWYIHFWHDQDVLVVFKDGIYPLRHNDRSTWSPALEHGRALGIPEEQLDFPI